MNVFSLQTGIISLAVMSDASTETHPQRPLSLLKSTLRVFRWSLQTGESWDIAGVFTGKNHRDPISKPLAGFPAGASPVTAQAGRQSRMADGGWRGRRSVGGGGSGDRGGWGLGIPPVGIMKKDGAS